MNKAVSSEQKPLDVICLGRVAVDLYGQQIGSRLEDMTTFAKYLGGSSGNVAYGTAIQGLRSAMLARVGDCWAPCCRWCTNSWGWAAFRWGSRSLTPCSPG